LTRVKGSPHGDDGTGEGELASTQIHKTCAARPRSPRCSVRGGLHIVSGKIVVEAELDTGAPPAAAQGHRRGLRPPVDVVMVQGNGIRKGSRYVVRVVKDGEALARQTGLLDQRGRPCAGCRRRRLRRRLRRRRRLARRLPGPRLAHRARPLARLEVTCPGPEAALALVGVARRLGIQAKAREVRGVDRVVIRDGDAIGQLLTRLGAHESLMAWEERRMRREVRATANRLANFDDANLRRSARAAVAAGARVERALEILGDEVPDHLMMAG
jgi:DNA-binding protein WhiA